MVLSAWVDDKWCYRRERTVSDVIGMGGLSVVLSAWVDGKWCYQREWTVNDVIEVGER